MNVKEFRIAKLLETKSGKSLIIPIDHGIMMGSVKGLEDPIKTLKTLINLGIDGTLITPGLAKITLDLFSHREAPTRILTADLPLLSNVPGGNGEIIGHEVISNVEFALKYDFDVIKILLPWGEREKVQVESIKVVEKLVRECDKWDIPLMIEPILWGEAISKEKRNDIKLIDHASRMALEMGADILKIPYSGNQKEFSDLVKRLKVPVFVLGGVKTENEEDILRVAWESTQAGAKGVIFGRNVWQSSKMRSIVLALKKIVHNGISANKVMKNL